MKFTTWKQARNLKDLGSLTELCSGCNKQVKIRDFVWAGKNPMVCKECELKKQKPKNV